MTKTITSWSYLSSHPLKCVVNWPWAKDIPPGPPTQSISSVFPEFTCATIEAASPTLAGSITVLFVLAKLEKALTYSSATLRLAAFSPNCNSIKNKRTSKQWAVTKKTHCKGLLHLVSGHAQRLHFISRALNLHLSECHYDKLNNILVCMDMWNELPLSHKVAFH